MSDQSASTCRLSLLVLAVGVVWMSSDLLRAQEDGFFPNTKKLGQAAVEYRDDDVHVVAAYYYSQRNHDSRWLLIETAMSTTRGMVIDRDDIKLVTPEGRDVFLPTQARFAQEVSRVRPVLQNASTTRHGVLNYFSQRSWSEGMRLFALPGGTVLTNFVTDADHVARGDLFFESPTGLWTPGTYTLVIERDGTRAVVPIELE
jgi:hypothetical protein